MGESQRFSAQLVFTAAVFFSVIAWILNQDPGVLIFAYTAGVLACFWPRALKQLDKRNESPRWIKSCLLPAVLLAGALLPGFAQSSDQSPAIFAALLLPAMLQFSLLYLEGEDGLLRAPKIRESLMIAVSIAAASLLKPVQALLLPLLALLSHSFFISFPNPRQFVSRIFVLMKSFGFVFAGAGLFAYAFHPILRNESSSSQASKNEWMVFLSAIWIGGSFLSSLVFLGLAHSQNPKQRKIFTHYSKWGFAFSWVLAACVFYGATSASLLDDLWCVWPALCLGTCILLTKAYGVRKLKRRKRVPDVFDIVWLKVLWPAMKSFLFIAAVVPSVVGGFGFLIIALVPKSSIVKLMSGEIPQVGAMSLANWPESHSFGCVLVSICFFLQMATLTQFRRASDERVPRLISIGALTNAVILIVTGISVSPFLRDVLRARCESHNAVLRDTFVDQCLSRSAASSPVRIPASIKTIRWQ